LFLEARIAVSSLFQLPFAASRFQSASNCLLSVPRKTVSGVFSSGAPSSSGYFLCSFFPRLFGRPDWRPPPANRSVFLFLRFSPVTLHLVSRFPRTSDPLTTSSRWLFFPSRSRPLFFTFQSFCPFANFSIPGGARWFLGNG